MGIWPEAVLFHGWKNTGGAFPSFSTIASR